MPLDATTPGRLRDRFLAASPRITRPATPLRSMAIHAAAGGLWAVLLAAGLFFHGVAAWGTGLLYIGYDTALLLFVAWHLPRAPRGFLHNEGPAPTLAVLIAARNEEHTLAGTVAALLHGTDTPDEILIMDDGSADGTASVADRLAARTPIVRVQRLAGGGKAAALNAGWVSLRSDVVVTLDADTRVTPGAMAAMRRAFARDPGLVAATGVLEPECAPGAWSGALRWFQGYEYVRNFLGRHAWGGADCLLLISGAFAGFQREAVLAVGGFDTDCLVEDYELIHRLRRFGARAGLGWRTAVVGEALAETDAPATPGAFLRQRRRWFGGFLQVQYWYRAMVGDPSYGRVGTWMLPVKAADTLQPIYGLSALALLPVFAVSGRAGLLLPVGLVMLAKVALDVAFLLAGIVCYRRWTGGGVRVRLSGVVLAACLEPFSFQVLRHLAALAGWHAAIRGRLRWR